jgi:hypothetical protein
MFLGGVKVTLTQGPRKDSIKSFSAIFFRKRLRRNIFRNPEYFSDKHNSSAGYRVDGRAAPLSRRNDGRWTQDETR